MVVYKKVSSFEMEVRIILLQRIIKSERQAAVMVMKWAKLSPNVDYFREVK